MVTSKTGCFYPVFKYTGLLLVSLLVSLLLSAQNEEEVLDTIVMPVVAADSTLPDLTQEPPPPADEVNNSFLPRSSQLNGGGPDSLIARKVSPEQVQKLRGDEAFWYANYIFQKKKEKENRGSGTSFTNSSGFQLVLWMIIVGVFIAVLVVYLSNSNVRLFRKNKAITFGETEAETEDIFAIHYQKEIDKAVSTGNFRLAVRLQFLQLLRTLSEKNIIDYKQDRTNFDYLMQMNNRSWYADFFRLTRSYEYSWYGQFDIDWEKYAVIKNEFESLDRKLR